MSYVPAPFGLQSLGALFLGVAMAYFGRFLGVLHATPKRGKIALGNISILRLLEERGPESPNAEISLGNIVL